MTAAQRRDDESAIPDWINLEALDDGPTVRRRRELGAVVLGLVKQLEEWWLEMAPLSGGQTLPIDDPELRDELDRVLGFADLERVISRVEALSGRFEARDIDRDGLAAWAASRTEEGS
jgi:hypothetical protein